MLLLPILGGGGKYTIFFKKKKNEVPSLFLVFDGSQQLPKWLLRCVRVACY